MKSTEDIKQTIKQLISLQLKRQQICQKQ